VHHVGFTILTFCMKLYDLTNNSNSVLLYSQYLLTVRQINLGNISTLFIE
jgi:hypothetical protein